MPMEKASRIHQFRSPFMPKWLREYNRICRTELRQYYEVDGEEVDPEDHDDDLALCYVIEFDNHNGDELKITMWIGKHMHQEFIDDPVYLVETIPPPPPAHLLPPHLFQLPPPPPPVIQIDDDDDDVVDID